MRIIAGKARGIDLAVPAGLAVRPTAGRAREALFSSLGDFSGVSVLDLFAGSGALGLEAASRGAVFAGFVERERRHRDVIETNIAKVRKSGADFTAQVIAGDAEHGYVRAEQKPDIIFADPPYAESAEYFRRMWQKLTEWAPEALLVWELPDMPGSAGEFLTAAPDRFTLRRFGGVDFFLSK